MDNTALQHHGVFGMKWGVRRYQKKDGSLTPTGKRRLKLKSEKQDTEKADPKSSNTRNIKDMTDEELSEQNARLRLEQEYLNLNKQISSLSPEEVSNGKKIVDSVINKMVVPAATDVGRQVVKSMMTRSANKVFDLDDELKVYTNNKKK